MKKRQRKRQRHKNRSNRAAAYSDNNYQAAKPAIGEDVKSATGYIAPESSFLTHAVRATGILPIVVLVGILTTHHLYAGHIPLWFIPIIEKQVATLTLCAGHAAIIGLWINREIKHRWSTFALVVAALATAGAGYRSIGEDVAGHVLVVMLFMLLIPAIWAESISRVISRTSRLFKSKNAFFLIGLVLWVPLIYYNQLHNENYIRNWLLIPLGILCGFIVSAFLLWLSFKYIPVAYSWCQKGLVNTYKNWFRRRNTI